jgi:hypothetical protein
MADVYSHIQYRASAVQCCGLEKSLAARYGRIVGAWLGHGLATALYIHESQSHCVVQKGKTQSKSSTTRHGMVCVYSSLEVVVQINMISPKYKGKIK